MYAVIFRATIKQLDQEYEATAERLRELAFKSYGCLDFVSYTKDQEEVAISYWPDQAHILAWKNDPQHKQAQEVGKRRWYQSVKVQVVKVEREYSS